MGGYATLSAYATVTRYRDPDAAFAALPRDAQVKAALAEKLSGPDGTAATRRQADILARAALARDPLNVSAAASLGINAAVRSDKAHAQQAFAYAMKLSRRDFRAQLWAIENAVEHGQIVGALHYYDMTLRTQLKSSALLFPVLAQAIAVPDVQTAMITLLGQRPPWRDAFLGYLSSSADPVVAGKIVHPLLVAGYRVPVATTDNLIGSLVLSGNLADAWQIYTDIHPGASHDGTRASDFAQPDQASSAFDWNPINDGAISASIDADGGRHTLNFTISSGGNGTIVQQLQYLRPGRYLFNSEITDVRQPRRSQPYWTLVCLNGSELGRIEIGTGDPTRFSGEFVVPSNCPASWLRMVARSSDSVEGVMGSVVTARLQAAQTGNGVKSSVPGHDSQ